MLRLSAFVALSGAALAKPALLRRALAASDAMNVVARCAISSNWRLSGRGHVFPDRTVVRYRTGAPSLMNALVKGDEKLHLSYKRIQNKYRQEHGLLEFAPMKLWGGPLCGVGSSRIGGISHATTQIHIFLATRRSVSNDGEAGRQGRRARSTPSMPACTALVPQNAIHVTVLVRMAGK